MFFQMAAFPVSGFKGALFLKHIALQISCIQSIFRRMIVFLTISLRLVNKI